MRKLSYLLIIILLVSGGMLIAFAPDTLSLLFVAIAESVVVLSVIFGLAPVISYTNGLHNGMVTIQRIQAVQTSSAWYAMMQVERFFRQKTLDGLFQEYREKLRTQNESGQLFSDLDDFINEDVLALRSWQTVMLQVPGTLTGIGILGTFLGLIMGIGSISFSTVEAALFSVQSLLNGIELAFYTSICGVILSILFNITYRITWNMMLRDLGLFQEDFHKYVVPPMEEQKRYRERKDIVQITELLERLPRLVDSYSAARGDAGVSRENEQILMPQILAGLQNGEFIFYLQPKYDLATRRIIGAEALVRWQHKKLGIVSPGVFVPVLEQNGYITKLDQFIWEEVCKTIRRWIDNGLRPVPISVNVTKTDVLALDIGGFFKELLKKYRIPPRSLEIEIAQNAYTQARDTASEAESILRQDGLRVLVDGFAGDFLSLDVGGSLNADALKLDLRDEEAVQGSVAGVFEQARTLHIPVCVEGIESMEQLTAMRKYGATEGQGYLFSKPVSVEQFEEMMKKEAELKPDGNVKVPKRWFERTSAQGAADTPSAYSGTQSRE